MNKWLALLLAGALLAAGCARKPDPTPQPPPPTPGPGAEAPKPPALVRDGDGFRIDAEAGGLGYTTWLGDNRLLVSWFPPESPHRHTLLANLDAGTLTPLNQAGDQREHVSPTGSHAILIADHHAHLLEASTGALRPLAGGGCGEQSPALSVRWLSGTQLLLVTQSSTPRKVPDWGCLSLMEASGTTTRLPGEGALAAVLPGGKLLVQSPWVDGALQLHTPPYDTAPQEIAPPGPLRSGFSLSPDGKQLAWVEYLPPLDDWSTAIPGYCCGSQGPPAKELKLWEIATGKLTTLPASGQRFYQVPTWRRDGKRLIMEAHTPDTALIQLNLDGTSRELHRGRFVHHYQVVAEAPDGTLTLRTDGDERGQNWARLFRLFPDGREAVIIEGLPADWEVQGTTLTVRREGKTTRTDLLTGQVTTADREGSLSPGGRWVATQALPDNPHVIHIRPSNGKQKGS